MPKSAANKGGAKKSAPAAKVQSPASKTLGAAEAFAAFLPEAKAIAAERVEMMRVEPGLARHNVTVGLAAVLPHEATLAALPAPFDLEQLKSLDALSLALVHAAAQVHMPSAGTTRKQVLRATELRDLLLSAAVPLAKAKLLPAAVVKKIQSGQGPRDFAQDCVDLAKLFRDHAAAIKGKSPITKEQIDEAATIGTALLGTLKPARAKKTRDAEEKEAAELRDRLWTLLQTRHRDQLRRAGAWLWVDQVDEYVPLLGSAKATRRPAPKPEAPKA